MCYTEWGGTDVCAANVGVDKQTEAGLNVVVGKEIVDYFN